MGRAGLEQRQFQSQGSFGQASENEGKPYARPQKTSVSAPQVNIELSVALLRILDAPGLANDIHLNLAGILHIAFNLLGDVARQLN